MKLKNNAKKWTLISLIIIVIGIVMLIMGIVNDDYNYTWMIFVGIILILTFVICFFMFVGQAKRLNDMFNNVGLLAHWSFESYDHMAEVEKEFKERKRMNKTMLIIITIFFVVIGGFFLIFKFDDADEAGFFAIMMIAVLAIIYIAALAAPRARYNNMKKSPPEIYVGPYSAWVMGEYQQWKAPMTRMTDVVLTHDDNGHASIAVNYFILQRYGPQMHTCRIPVPAGSEIQAEDVASNIATANKVAFKIV